MDFDLFAPAQPQHPTSTQRAVRTNVPSDLKVVVSSIRLAGSRGRTPSELAAYLRRNIVTIRARCTQAHQAGEIVRTARSRENQLVYVAPVHWEPVMGQVAPRHHKGRPA